MDIDFLVGRLEEMVMGARKVPMTNQVILEQPPVLDLIDQLRVAIPEEVRTARRTNQDTERVIASAREEAEHIIEAAQEQAAMLLQDQAILREAEQKAQEIEEAAADAARETTRGADEYAAGVLTSLQGDLERTLAIVRKSLDVLEARRAEAAE